MLTLESGSICDVCADEYGPRNLPHSIPCGHVLCLSCCTSIVEKTSKAPLCPFCREEFSRSSIRKIRIDFPGGSGAGSGFSTPRRSPRSPRAPLVEDDFPHDLLMKVNSAGGMVAGGEDAAERRTQEARRLETRVLRVASQKTSVDEVTTLQRELQDWLGSDKAHSEMSTSLYLSALLLRAIISNHFAFSEASKVAKSTETTLRQRVDDLERDRTRLETEVHKLNHQLQKVRTPPTSPPSTRVSSPTAQVGTTSMPSAPPHPISRLTQGHYRSQSVAPTARSATPAGTPLARSNTPAISSTPSSTSTSPFSSSRSPASSTAGYTSPYATSMSSTQSQSHVPARATTPAPHTYRSTAPTPSPSSARKVGRTISTTAPPGSIPRSMSVAPSMMGSHHGHSASVGAGAGEHARWIPDPRVAAESSRPLGPRVPVMSRG